MTTYLSNSFSIQMIQEFPLSCVEFRKLSCALSARDELGGNFVSVIRHEDLAALVSAELNLPVPVNRQSIKLEFDDKLIVAQYTGPCLEPGTTTLPEGAKIEYWLIEILTTYEPE